MEGWEIYLKRLVFPLKSGDYSIVKALETAASNRMLAKRNWASARVAPNRHQFLADSILTHSMCVAVSNSSKSPRHGCGGLSNFCGYSNSRKSRVSSKDHSPKLALKHSNLS